MSNELEMVINNYKEKGMINLVAGVTEEQIAKFETAKDLKIPERYRDFLKVSNGGELGEIKFCGITEKPLVDEIIFEELLKSFILIGEMENGNLVIYPLRSEKVVIYNKKDDDFEEKEYPDFVSFLK